MPEVPVDLFFADAQYFGDVLCPVLPFCQEGNDLLPDRAHICSEFKIVVAPRRNIAILYRQFGFSRPLCCAFRLGGNTKKGATMLELLKKGMLAGIGAAVLTRDKIREATRMLVEEGKISSDEAEKLSEDLVKSGEKEWEEINSKFQSSFKKISENLEVVRKKEFLDLKAKVELLEQRLSQLEETSSRQGGAAGNG